MTFCEDDILLLFQISVYVFLCADVKTGRTVRYVNLSCNILSMKTIYKTAAAQYVHLVRGHDHAPLQE